MHKFVRSVAFAVAASAMMLRAFLPLGWMPSTDTHAPLIICPMMGGTMHGAPGQHGAPQHHDRFCPFTASLAQLAAASTPPVAPVPASRIAGDDFQPEKIVFVPAAYRSQSPRAPPLIA